MKHILAGMAMAFLVVVLTLGAMAVLVGATLAIAELQNPAVRALAVLAELVLGVILLVGTVYVATHLAVRIFAPRESAPH